MIEDHKQIWLEPLSEDDDYVYGDRTWCQDDVWDSNDYNGVHATKYIRADLAEFQISELEGRVRELEGALSYAQEAFEAIDGKLIPNLESHNGEQRHE